MYKGIKHILVKIKENIMTMRNQMRISKKKITKPMKIIYLKRTIMKIFKKHF